MEKGIKITNITEVIQYVPGKGLLPFAQRVVQLRSEATDEGDDAKQLTAKLFGIVSFICGFRSKLNHPIGKRQQSFTGNILNNFCDI